MKGGQWPSPGPSRAAASHLHTPPFLPAPFFLLLSM